MCHYITLIAPCADQDAVSEVMDRHGRAATPIANPSVARVLKDGECQYLTTRGHCDCGTALVPGLAPGDADAAHAKEAAKLARKGWTQAKIARAMDGRRKAAARPGRDGPDSVALWAAIVDDLLASLKLPHVGLLVHFYSGDVRDEVFTAMRRDAAGAAIANLESMRPDEVLVLRKT